MSKQSYPLYRKFKGLMLKAMPGMITCREFEEFIIDYLEQSLPKEQVTLFERHLKLCRECRDYLAAYSTTRELSLILRDRSPDKMDMEIPADLITAVVDSIGAQKEPD